MKYTAKQLANGQVGIFEGDHQIGQYGRNYHSYASSTFFPFEQDGRWFALYSPYYTCTRLMSLPDCKDIGGEEPNSCGFCPVEYFVPQITTCSFKPDEVDPPPYNPRHDPDRWAKKNERGFYEWPKNDPLFEQVCQKQDEEFDIWSDRHPYRTKFAPWGFVAGCVWGDDCSWKIQFLDLSRASEGILTRDDRFGYIELPRGIPLAQAVNVENFEYNHQVIEIALPVRFKLTGERIHV